MRTCLRLMVAAACVTGVAASAPAAMAASGPTIRFDIGFDNTAGGGAAFISDNADSSGTHSYQTNLLRGGAVIASDTEKYPGGYVDVPNGGQLAAGDTLQYLIDGVEAKRQSYDGIPSVNGLPCVGATQFSGAENDAATFQVYVGTPGSGSSYTEKPSTFTRGNGAYTATVSQPFGSRDWISVYQTINSGDTSMWADAGGPPQNCASSNPTPAGSNTNTNTNPAPNPAPASSASTSMPSKPTLVQIVAALKQLAGRDAMTLNALDLAKFLSGGGASLPVSFLVPGRFRALLLSGAASSRSAGIAKKAKAVTVASGSATRSTPGAASLALRLSKAGRKLLRHRSSAHLTLQLVFTPADGSAAQTSTSKVTLKKHKKSKKAKKGSKRG